MKWLLCSHFHRGEMEGGGRSTHQASRIKTDPTARGFLLKARLVWDSTPPVLEWAPGSEEGHSNWLWQSSWRQDAGRVHLPGKDRWRADTPYRTWSRNVNDDRSTCGLEPSPVSSGWTMTGTCVQIITTPQLTLPTVPSQQVPKDQKNRQ